MTNTTSRSLLSLGLGRTFEPGDSLPSTEAIKALPEWDALRQAFDRGEFKTPAKALSKSK